MDLKAAIRSIPDFPEKGIIFRDITTLLKDPVALKASIDVIKEQVHDEEYDIIVAPESRGFIFGMPLAYSANKGFVPIRKAGKLPAEVISKEYDLEYGSAVVEMHKDALEPGQRVVIVDDLLATGGTSKAMIELVESTGAKIAALVFLIELEGLNGRQVLEGYKVTSVVKY